MEGPYQNMLLVLQLLGTSSSRHPTGAFHLDPTGGLPFLRLPGPLPVAKSAYAPGVIQ